MWNLLIFEIVDAITVATAGWLIARALSSSAGPVTVPPPVFDLAELDNVVELELPTFVEAEPELTDDGIEWPASTWRAQLAASAWD